MDARGATARLARSAAVETWLWSRAAIWAAALLALAWFPSRHAGGFGASLWARWDSGWFVKIAHHGYASDAGAPAFFPLYPGIVAVLGRILGGRYVLAGLLVSLAASLVAFELLRRIAERRLGDAGAYRAVLYLAVFPTALFLQAVYSESLYLALALAAFLLAEDGRWAPAWVAAGLALLTRSSGIALVAALLVLAWPSRGALARAAIVPVLFAAFPLGLWWQVGSPWRFLHAQADWDRSLSPAGPLGGIWDAFAALGRTPEDFTYRHALAVNLEALAFLALALALIPLVFRRFGAAYGTFCVLSLALPLSLPDPDFPLLSWPRFMLVVFPFFLALAVIGARPRVNSAIVATSAIFLGVAIVQWVTYEWVA